MKDFKWEINFTDAVLERALRHPGGEWIGWGRVGAGRQDTVCTNQLIEDGLDYGLPAKFSLLQLPTTFPTQAPTPILVTTSFPPASIPCLRLLGLRYCTFKSQLFHITLFLCCMPDTNLSIWQVLDLLIFTATEVNTVIILTSQLKKQVQRAITNQGYIGSKWQRQDLNPRKESSSSIPALNRNAMLSIKLAPVLVS